MQKAENDHRNLKAIGSNIQSKLDGLYRMVSKSVPLSDIRALLQTQQVGKDDGNASEKIN